MTRVHEVSREELEERRRVLLADVGMTFEEMAAKAESYALMADEWAVWEEIRAIDFLLSGD